MEEEWILDDDWHYESWRDDAGCQLEESCTELIDTFLNEKGGYYEGKDERLFEHLIKTVGNLLGKEVTIRPISKSFKRINLEVEKWDVAGD